MSQNIFLCYSNAFNQNIYQFTELLKSGTQEMYQNIYHVEHNFTKEN